MPNKLFPTFAALVVAAMAFGAVLNQSQAATLVPLVVSFIGANGRAPNAPLIVDAAGNLFGTTLMGGASDGGAYNLGSTFEIAKTSAGYATTPTTLINFNRTNGSIPSGSLIIDAAGNLFGTTQEGGNSANCGDGCGTVFEIAKTAGGYAGAPNTLVNFNGANGSGPVTGLIADAAGNLFGTTSMGGASNNDCGYYGCGAVFDVTGSCFVVPELLSLVGTLGAADCIGKSASALARKFHGLIAAPESLKFASVRDLQSALVAYCGT